ncbi:hypothetical protein EYZ11_009049 [Aspergillus tanneri]|uniref:NmrA-like domain-containing protein n=1 Tax=Aspergillus tanneri TaxID=1220188 RepID=A0A4S3J992_9EURO|nr:uncharacterized protein ATNIH1004_009671 [Aspergillus tanneri]KAA8642910.1 hypothetical protein ATNIH1004_009671 [Aspergillus tanneri]THC91492.1 hypothetical protein EYZ11_009049 [Aspergillus tanneri]
MAPTKVALAGGTGNLGRAVLKALLDADFEVTVLSRSSQKPVDERATIIEVDYDSLDSLTSALSDHDIVVNTIGRAPTEVGIRLIDAAVVAGVKHFLPSEYGTDTTHEKVRKVPLCAGRVAIQEHLKKVARESSLFYTLLIPGAFLDYGLQTGFILNLAGPVADLYDGGDRKFSTTTLPGIGKAVVGIIRNPEATKNSAVFVSEADVSQNQMLEISGKRVETRVVRTADLEKEAYAELKKPNPRPAVFAVNFIRLILFGEGFGSLIESDRLSNELLGLRYLTEGELRDMVSRYI